ncbi:MAG: hypothetical protein AAF485_13980, partial [Chloroflexota bacterium]
PNSLFQEGDYTTQRVKTLLHAYPRLRPLLNALSWTTYLTPNDLANILQWLEANAEAVQSFLINCPENKGVVTALHLCNLARRDGHHRVAPLLHFLSDPRAHTLIVRDANVYLRQWVVTLRRWRKQRSFTQPEPAKAQFVPELLDFIAWLVRQNRATRQRALELFALMLPLDFFDTWEVWWTDIVPRLNRAEQLIQDKPSTRYSREEAAQLALQLETRQKHDLIKPHLNRLLIDLQRIAEPDNLKLYRAAKAALQQMPCVYKTTLLRAAFLHRWMNKRYRRNRQHLPALLRAFEAFLATYGHQPNIYEAWQNILNDWTRSHRRYYWDIFNSMLHEPDRQKRWPIIFETIALCYAGIEDPLEDYELRQVINLARITNDAQQATRYFNDLKAHDLLRSHISFALGEYAHSTIEGDDQFVPIIATLQRAGLGYHEVGVQLVKLQEQLATQGWSTTLAPLILNGQAKLLWALSQSYTTLNRLRVPIVSPPQPTVCAPPDWVLCYPAGLHITLNKLATLTTDAERVADRILGKHLPTQTKITTEITALKHLLSENPDQAYLSKRLKNLSQRLKTPPTLSPARLARLEKKLELAYQRLFLEQWLSDLNQALHQKLTDHLKIDPLPDWVLAPKNLEALTAILQLEAPFQKLGLRVLRQRCGPPPWNLWDDSANQAFLETLHQQNIDPNPWLYPAVTLLKQGKNGRKVWISFEDDPLEIFHMGGHFNTCLSPDSFNFFSVITNTADINKRVIYARDETGKVIGRCLLALTDIGGILTFHPYCHDSELGFAEIVGEVVESLANQMGTVIVTDGPVPNLVATGWYNDGPQTISKQFEFLKPKSPFRQALGSIEIDEFVPQLEAAFAPLPLNTLTLEVVLQLEELKSRPELIIPLLPFIESSPNLSSRSWLTAAQIAYKAGEKGFAKAVITQRAIPYLLDLHQREHWVDLELVEILAKYDPYQALQILRKTRSKGYRADQDEVEVTRRNLIADIYETLGRPVQAQKMREKKQH